MTYKQHPTRHDWATLQRRYERDVRLNLWRLRAARWVYIAGVLFLAAVVADTLATAFHRLWP